MFTTAHAAGKVSLIPQTPTLYEGSAQQMEIKLSQPIICPTLPDGVACEVTLDLSSSDPSRLSISPNSVSYLANEWAQTRVVTVEATIDSVYTLDSPITITATAGGTAPFYTNSISTTSITVNNLDPFVDMNGDSISDDGQPNLSSYTSSLTGKTVVIDVGENCEITTDDIISENNLPIQDADYVYENGLFDFKGACSPPGFTTTVHLYYYDVSISNLTMRKFNPNTQQYSNIPGATLEQRTINGHSVAVASYQITDGGELDMDGVENGEFADPAGIATVSSVNQTSTLADTGSGQVQIAGILAAIILLVLPAYLILSRKFLLVHNSQHWITKEVFECKTSTLDTRVLVF